MPSYFASHSKVQYEKQHFVTSQYESRKQRELSGFERDEITCKYSGPKVREVTRAFTGKRRKIQSYHLRLTGPEVHRGPGVYLQSGSSPRKKSS